MMIFTSLFQESREIFRPRLMPRGLERRFPRKVDLSFKYKNLEVKTIETYTELQEVMELRREVFLKEFSGRRFTFRSDRDAYDRYADYLVVKDTSLNKIVGSYRVISSLHSPIFYSASEFHIEDFVATPDVKIELSRACIHKNYRTGAVISLLWKGISQYMQKIGAGYLFGCASIQTTCPVQSDAVYQSFVKNGQVHDSLSFGVRPEYQFKAASTGEESTNATEAQAAAIPALLRSYLSAGARICSPAALDRKFRCIDYLIVLDTQNIAERYRSRYVA